MTDATADQPRPFSEVIESIGERPGETLCLGEVVDTFGQQAFGPVMFFFALVNMMPWPPGGTTLTGAPLLLLSFELAIGRDELWIPRWTERVSLKRPLFRKFNGRFKRGLKLTERLSRPRLHVLTGQIGRVLIGPACTFLSIVLVLPVWGGQSVTGGGDRLLCAWGDAAGWSRRHHWLDADGGDGRGAVPRLAGDRRQRDPRLRLARPDRLICMDVC